MPERICQVRQQHRCSFQRRSRQLRLSRTPVRSHFNRNPTTSLLLVRRCAFLHMVASKARGRWWSSVPAWTLLQALRLDLPATFFRIMERPGSCFLTLRGRGHKSLRRPSNSSGIRILFVVKAHGVPCCTLLSCFLSKAPACCTSQNLSIIFLQRFSDLHALLNLFPPSIKCNPRASTCYCHGVTLPLVLTSCLTTRWAEYCVTTVLLHVCMFAWAKSPCVRIVSQHSGEQLGCGKLTHFHAAWMHFIRSRTLAF